MAFAVWGSLQVRLPPARRRRGPGIVPELAVVLALVVTTGAWQSPFVFCLLAPAAAMGLSSGLVSAVAFTLASCAVVTTPVIVHGLSASRAQNAAQWTVELVLVAVVAGNARRLFGEVELQRTRAVDRLAQLSEANALLTSLHDVAQTLPASLDMGEVATSTISSLRELVDFDVAALLLLDPATSTWSVALAEGVQLGQALAEKDLPVPLRVAASGTTVWLEPRLSSETGLGIDPFSRSGVYAPLHARGALIGLIAIEHGQPDHFGAADIKLLEGFVEPAALAVDNARWFSRLRTVGAHEERSRIARDLHDRLGQSLAYLGFQLDRLVRLADTEPVGAEICQLRDDVRSVTGEVRETLYDLRTDVSQDQGLGETLQAFLERVGERAGLDVTFQESGDGRLALPREREVWRIAQEAITNAERHSSGTRVQVTWHCDEAGSCLVVFDDGRGFPTGQLCNDSYGLLGMRERADAIGATLEVESSLGRGTLIRCRLDQP